MSPTYGYGSQALQDGQLDEGNEQAPRSERRLQVVKARPGTLRPAPLPATPVNASAVLPDFDEAFRTHAPHLRRIARRVLGADDEVEDVVQDVFIRAHQRLPDLRNAAAMRSWLGTITVRVARRRLRSGWFSRVWRGEDAHAFEQRDPSATPEHYAIVSSFNRYLQRLPADQRLAWVLCEVEEKTLPEAAKISACSLSTVTRRLQAAKSRIRKAMRD
jgi:RNA polymerase sigma-70 factor (ECF subfamily)